MAGLKELRTRIEGVKSTSKITSAMKMVAASKFRRAQLTLERSEAYQKMLEDNIKKVLYFKPCVGYFSCTFLAKAMTTSSGVCYF